MKGLIYKTINLINQKIYIGQTIRDDSNYIGGGKSINNAIKKYKKENFKKEILEYCNSQKELNEREIYWIKKLNSTNRKIGYNLLSGGKNGYQVKPTQETKNKISKANKGKKFSEEHKKCISESRKQGLLSGKIIPHNKGKKCPWVVKTHKGKIVSKKTRELMSKNHTDISGSKNPNSKYVYSIISPDRKIFKNITNLKLFCQSHNLNYYTCRWAAQTNYCKLKNNWKINRKIKKC